MLFSKYFFINNIIVKNELVYMNVHTSYLQLIVEIDCSYLSQKRADDVSLRHACLHSLLE